MAQPEYVRVTDDVKPKRTWSVLAQQYDADLHKKVENERDVATYENGDPRPVKYYTTADAEAKKKSGRQVESDK